MQVHELECELKNYHCGEDLFVELNGEYYYVTELTYDPVRGGQPVIKIGAKVEQARQRKS